MTVQDRKMWSPERVRDDKMTIAISASYIISTLSHDALQLVAITAPFPAPGYSLCSKMGAVFVILVVMTSLTSE